MWTCGRGFANFCSLLSPRRYNHWCFHHCQLQPPRRLRNPPGNPARDSEIFKSSKTFLYFLFISVRSLVFSRRKAAKGSHCQLQYSCVRLIQLFLLGHMAKTTKTHASLLGPEHACLPDSVSSECTVNCRLCFSCNSQTTKMEHTDMQHGRRGL